MFLLIINIEYASMIHLKFDLFFQLRFYINSHLLIQCSIKKYTFSSSRYIQLWQIIIDLNLKNQSSYIT